MKIISRIVACFFLTFALTSTTFAQDVQINVAQQNLWEEALILYDERKDNYYCNYRRYASAVVITALVRGFGGVPAMPKHGQTVYSEAQKFLEMDFSTCGSDYVL